jgi:hypothetical protein
MSPSRSSPPSYKYSDLPSSEVEPLAIGKQPIYIRLDGDIDVRFWSNRCRNMLHPPKFLTKAEFLEAMEEKIGNEQLQVGGARSKSRFFS